MISDDIKVEHEDGVAWILFDRPEVNNAVRGESMRDLCEALDEAIADPAVKVIVLGSTGRHFVAGAEFAFLDRLSAMSGAEIKAEVYAWFQGAARRLWGCSKPTIAAVSGAAVTVGCELALLCDFRVVTQTAVFQESWIRLGLRPPLGGLKLLPNMIGLARANDMVLRGRPVKGEEAVRIGLATELAPDDGLREAARALARELAGAAHGAYREAKAGLHRGLEGGMDGEWQANVLAQAMLIGGHDFKEGLAAVKDKRPARFTGG